MTSTLRRPRRPRSLAAVFALYLALLAACAPAQSAARAPAPAAPDPALVARLQAKLDSLHAAGRFPGATVGIALPDGTTFGLAVGQSDTARDLPMRVEDRMLSGSVGKTYFAAVALQLVSEGKLRLGDPIAKYLGGEPWFDRLPNARDVTVRMLMNHTSGLVRYELNERFLRDLTADPDRSWTPEDRLAYLFDARAPFAAGQGWDYSDTNYIVLGAIIERITGAPLYAEAERRVLRPLGLASTVPSDSRRIIGLAQGYAGPDNPFGGTDAMIGADGRFAVNPQFEWAGGGFASTAGDLARWAKALYEGRAFPRAMLDSALVAVPAPMLGREASYGLGVIIRPSPLGPTWGHSGYMPGYLTEVRYWPEHRVAVAFQANTSANGALGRAPGAIVADLARIVIDHLPPSTRATAP
ncbi:MAG TPA: serine hydrolase domain-containing protein [Longimicrobiaceae bacterium]|nr:serine hydrolase domain-containing protein [Longimicrobiaceae bacterium]